MTIQNQDTQLFLMCLQTIVLALQALIFLGTAFVGFEQVKKFKKDRAARIMKNISPTFKTYSALNRPEYDRIMAEIEKAVTKEIG